MIGGVTQWAIVGIVVAVCVAYALRALLPMTWRRALAVRLRRSGLAALADRLDAADGGCAACARNPGSGAPRR